MSSSYVLNASQFQPVYDRMLGVARLISDDNLSKEGDPQTIIPDQLSALDLASLGGSERERFGFEAGLSKGTTVFIRDDKLLQKVYAQLRNLDERDGALDGRILLSESPKSVLFSSEDNLTTAFHEKFSRSVFEVTVTTAPNKGGGQGTASIYSKEKLAEGKFRYTLVSNHHVVEKDDAEELELTLSHPDLRGKVIRATVVGVDPLTDLSLIETTDIAEDLPVLETGDSTQLREGDRILAIGNTMGRGLVTVQGNVKSMKDGMEGYPYPLLRTEIPITNGNSGGPLLNEYGQVVGVVDRQDPEAKGIINFSIPWERAQKSIANMLQNRSRGGVIVGYWGIEFSVLSPKEREVVAPEYQAGVWIHSVAPTSPAAKGGIQQGDVLIEVDGDSKVLEIDREIDVYKLNTVILDSQPGKPVVLKVLRDGRTQVITIKTGSTFQGRPDTFHTGYPFAVRDITAVEARDYRWDRKGVVVILDGDRKALFDSLRNNSIITHVDGVETPTVAKFREVLKQAKDRASRDKREHIRVSVWENDAYFVRDGDRFAILPIH